MRPFCILLGSNLCFQFLGTIWNVRGKHSLMQLVQGRLTAKDCKIYGQG